MLSAKMPRMRRLLIPLVAAVAACGLLLRGCGFVHDEHIIGPYRLIAVDIDEQMSLSYDCGDGSAVGRVGETVFAVGWNDRYIVAKQHPTNDRTRTNFFYLDITKDAKFADPSQSVTGPLTEAEFNKRKSELALPQFTRVVRSLE